MQAATNAGYLEGLTMVETLYFTPGGARIVGPPPTSGEYLSRAENDPRALIRQANMERVSPEYRAMTEAATRARNERRIQDMPWYGTGTASRIGSTDAELQAAYDSLSDTDKVRARYMGPTGILQLAGMRNVPTPGSGFGGASPRDPVSAPTSPFSPGYDPLPPPAVLPPENPPIAPAPPPMPSINPSTPAPAPAPTPAPPIATAPPVPPSSPMQPSAQPTSPGAGAGTNVGPGPYPPYLGGQATWGNPTDPHLLPFSPGSILPGGQGGQAPSWWNEIIQPSPLAPPGFPTTARNPFFGNTGGFNVGSPYYSPMSTWGFYPMPHMAQHMPGSFGMATPGMGSWYTGSPVGFNPPPTPETPIGRPQMYSTPPAGPTPATNPATAGAPATSWTGVNAMPQQAGTMAMPQRLPWMSGGMFLGGV